MKKDSRAFLIACISLAVALTGFSAAASAEDTTMEVYVDQMKGTKQTITCKEPIVRDSTTMNCEHIAQSFKILMAPVKNGSEPVTVECMEGLGVFAYSSGFVKQCFIDKVVIVESISGNEMRCGGHIVFFGRGGVERCW
ncbi:MAG: hypothetical protein ABSG88_15250 [Bradyrhizobium sp.]